MISGDLVALFGASWCRLGLMDCTRTPVVSGFQCCFVLYFSCVQKPRTPVISSDLVDLFEPLKDLLKAFGVTLGALSVPTRLTCLKKNHSSATAEKHGPTAVGVSLGEILSKQVYLGRV